MHTQEELKKLATEKGEHILCGKTYLGSHRSHTFYFLTVDDYKNLYGHLLPDGRLIIVWPDGYRLYDTIEQYILDEANRPEISRELFEKVEGREYRLNLLNHDCYGSGHDRWNSRDLVVIKKVAATYWLYAKKDGKEGDKYLPELYQLMTATQILGELRPMIKTHQEKVSMIRMYIKHSIKTARQFESPAKVREVITSLEK